MEIIWKERGVITETLARHILACHDCLDTEVLEDAQDPRLSLLNKESLLLVRNHLEKLFPALREERRERDFDFYCRHEAFKDERLKAGNKELSDLCDRHSRDRCKKGPGYQPPVDEQLRYLELSQALRTLAEQIHQEYLKREDVRARFEEKTSITPRLKTEGLAQPTPQGVPKEHREGGLTVARLGWLIASK